MGTAGHVDHGKTSLIKALTNIDCDTHKEEKKRGITINLGFSHLNLPSGNSIGIVDVPGHKDFVNTMVSGASGIDFVLFTIAADSGIMPQTIEHLNIIETLDIKKIIFALTKVDLVDAELIDFVKIEILELIEKTKYKDSPIISVSNVTNYGLDHLTTEIENIIPSIEEKNDSGIFRMYIDRIFSLQGIGSIVTGSVLGGSISTLNEVYLLPNNKKLKIKSIQRHGETINTAFAGDRAAINISNLKPSEFEKGMLICNENIEKSAIADAFINIFDSKVELKLWSTLLFHTGTFESQVKVHLLNKNTLKYGETAIVQIHFEKHPILVNNDKFILRNSSGEKTIGGGICIDRNPLHHRKRTEKLITNLTLLNDNIQNEENLIELIKINLKKEGKALSINDLCKTLNKNENDIKETIGKSKEIMFHKEKNIFVNIEIEAKTINLILEEITKYHKQNYLFSDGVSTTYLFGKFDITKDKIQKDYIEVLLEVMLNKNLIKKVNNTWILNNYTIEINQEIQKDIDFIEKLFLDYELQKPVLSEIEEKCFIQKITKDKLKIYIKYLISKNKLVAYQNEFIHKSFVNKIKEQVILELKTNTNGINMSEFRQLTNCSKKTIPIFVGILVNDKVIKTREEGTHLYISLA